MNRIYRITHPCKQRKVTYNAKNMERSVVLKYGVISVLAKMNRNNEAGSDRIIIEMLLALDDFIIDMIIEIINMTAATYRKISVSS